MEILFSLAPSCSGPGSNSQKCSNVSNLLMCLVSNQAPDNYTLYTFNFTAHDTSATLVFALTGDGSGGTWHYWLLDNVSVHDALNNTNLIVNGDFEAGNTTGWTQFCNTAANCNANRSGQVTKNSCYAGTYCFVDICENFDYLQQTFSTIVNHVYIISFYLKITKTGVDRPMYVLLY